MMYTVTEDPIQLLNEYKDVLKDLDAYLEIIIFNSNTMRNQLFTHLGKYHLLKDQRSKKS